MPQDGFTQVVTIATDGTAPRPLGAIGHVAAYKHSFTLPGGAAQMSCTLQRPPTLRTDALDPGRVVRCFRGAQKVWEGKLDEPAPSPDGWDIVAHGTGALGADFNAMYTGAWTGNPDNAINAAIGRGLRWKNLTIGHPSGIWLGQASDPASTSIADMLTQMCSNGGLTWQVDCGAGANIIRLFPLPTVPNRLLIATSPVARTLGANVNFLHIRYQANYDGFGAAATFSTTTVSEPAAVVKHDPIEDYLDLSSVGYMTAAAAQAVGNAVLKQYQKASFGGPFEVSHGQLLTLGGTAIDLATEQAGTVCKVLFTDYSYGGEYHPGPVTFLTGEFEFDQDTGTAQVTPFQSFKTDISALLGAAAQNAHVSPAPAWAVAKRKRDAAAAARAKAKAAQKARGMGGSGSHRGKTKKKKSPARGVRGVLATYLGFGGLVVAALLGLLGVLRTGQAPAHLADVEGIRTLADQLREDRDDLRRQVADARHRAEGLVVDLASSTAAAAQTLVERDRQIADLTARLAACTRRASDLASDLAAALEQKGGT